MTPQMRCATGVSSPQQASGFERPGETRASLFKCGLRDSEVTQSAQSARHKRIHLLHHPHMPPLPPKADGPKPSALSTKSSRRSSPQVDGTKTSAMTTDSAHRDRAVADLAKNQHGVVALSQLQELGLGASAVRDRVKAGRLHRVHQGVFAVGHALLTREGRWMAAVLACGPDAVLSHRSAAALLGLRPGGSDAAVDVTAPFRRGRSPDGIAAHRDGTLRARDRIAVSGIPCISVARAILDLAGTRPMREVRNAITRAEVLRIFDLAEMDELLGRSHGRRGVARMRLLISEHDPRTELAKQELERRFLTLCRRLGIPLPEVNVPIDLGDEQLTVDFLWRQHGRIVETDGHREHGTPTAFEEDRRRDQRLALAGWQVNRCTWRQVVNESPELIQILYSLAGPASRSRLADGPKPSALSTKSSRRFPPQVDGTKTSAMTTVSSRRRVGG